MVSQGERAGPMGWPPDNEAEELLKWANPNPERVGCPPFDVLVELSRRQRPPSDEAYKHLGRCSPCYRQVRALQEEAAAATAVAAPLRSRALAAWVFAAAALVLALATWILVQRQGPRVESPPQQAQLDLRDYAVSRSGSQELTAKPVVLARGRLSLKIILPTGSQAGMYDLQIFDADLNPVAIARGEGRIENYLTTIETTLDLDQVPLGRYQLALRRQGEEWHWFPAEVQAPR